MGIGADHRFELRQATPGTATRPVVPRGMELAGAIGLGGIAFVHLLDLSDKFAEVPYLGVGYVLLIAACVASIVLILRHDRRGWVLGGTAAGATLLGYVLSRTTGLPASTDDIGNWAESLGVWSLVLEGGVVALAAFALRRTAPHRVPAPAA
jgi:hypothetical protein